MAYYLPLHCQLVAFKAHFMCLIVDGGQVIVTWVVLTVRESAAGG